MKKVTKRVTALLLSLIMLIGILPIEAFAEEVSPEKETEMTEIEDTVKVSEKEEKPKVENEEDNNSKKKDDKKNEADNNKDEKDNQKENENNEEEKIKNKDENKEIKKEANQEDENEELPVNKNGKLEFDDDYWKEIIEDPDADILSYLPYGYEINLSTGERVGSPVRSIFPMLYRSYTPYVLGKALAEWSRSLSFRNSVDGTKHQWLSGQRITRLSFKSDDVYCLQPGAPLHLARVSSDAVAGKSYWRKVGWDKQELIGLILYFGKGSNDGNYLAKQIMIWEAILNYRDADTGKVTNPILRNSVSGNGASEFRKAYDIISPKLINYLAAPSYASRFGTNAPTTKITKDAATGEWFGEMIDTTGRSDYMNIDKLNASSEAKQAKATFTKLTNGKKGLKVSFGTTEPDENLLKTLIFPLENNENQNIIKNADKESIVYADKSNSANQIILGKAKVDPIRLLFKLSKEAVPVTPDEPKPPKITRVPMNKYGEYEDESGLGGAKIEIYQTRKAEVLNEDGTVKEEAKEFDKPKRVASGKTHDDGIINLHVTGDGDYFAQEKEGTYATGGGYKLNGKRVSNYLTPETTGEEPIEFSVEENALSSDEPLEFYNYQQKGRITVEKQDTQTGSTPQGDGTFKGAKFKIFEVEGYDENGRPYGSTIQHMTTGVNGRATSDELQEGIHYCVEEINAPQGYLLYTGDKGTWYQEFVIEFDGDHDNETTDEYTLVDGKDGDKLKLGNTSSKPIICKNKVKEGYIKVNKFIQKDIDGNPYEDWHQPKMPVAGVVFDIYLASDTPKDENGLYIFRKDKTDGHILTEEEMLLNAKRSAGFITTIKTKIDGTAKTGVLPYGKYLVIERVPLTGYDRPQPAIQWVDTKVKWYAPTHEFVPVIGGDGKGNDNNLGLEHNPPSENDNIPVSDVKMMQAMADIEAKNDYNPDTYYGYLDEDEYKIVFDYFYDYLTKDHYIDEYGNEQDELGNPYDEAVIENGGKKLTETEIRQYAEDLTRNLILYYASFHTEDIQDEGNVYTEHLAEYKKYHNGKVPNTVDMLTYTLNIENQTTKRYVRIVKKDAVSGKLIPLNNFYFKVWDCSRKRWVEDNRNNASLGNISIWQTNAQGQVFSKPNKDGDSTDLQGTASLADFLEYGEDGYDIYEIHSHSGYYLTDKPIHFSFNSEENPVGTPIIVEFKDKPVLGNATIHKTGQGLISLDDVNEKGVSKPQFGKVNLQGAIFGVYAAEDIKALDIDETIRKNRNTDLSYTYTVDKLYPHKITFDYDKDLKKDALIETIQTDIDGKATTSNLYCGKYYLKELYSPVGYKLDETHIPFEIKDTHNKVFVETDTHLNPQSPTASNPDKKTTKANIDYSKEKERLGNISPKQKPTLEPLEMVSVKSNNERQHVNASFVKNLIAPVNTETLDWNGTTIKIFEKADIKGLKPILTLTAKTASQVIAQLKPGEYYAVMTKAPKEVNCRTDKYEFTVTVPQTPNIEQLDKTESNKKDTVKKEKVTIIEMTDILINFPIELSKAFKYTYTKEEEMKHLITPPSELFDKVTFGLYASENIISDEDHTTVVIKKDTLLDIIQVNRTGIGANVTDLPIGKYYLKELTTAEGYEINDELHEFRFYPKDDKINIVIPVTVDPYVNRTSITIDKPKPPTPTPPHHHHDNPEPKPEPMPKPEPHFGKLEIKKTSSFDGKILPNATYGIYTADNVLIQKLTTDKDGKAISKSLPVGQYILKELKAPKHYKISPQKNRFTIQDDKIVKVDVEDEPIFGKIIPNYVNPDELSGQGGNPYIDTSTNITGFHSPKTGENPFINIVVILLLIISGVIIILTTRKKKNIVASILALLVLVIPFVCSETAFAATANDTTTTVKTIISENPKEKYKFPEKKNVNDKTYTLKNVDYKTLSEKELQKDEEISRAIEYQNLDKKVAKTTDNINVKLNGKDYSLPLKNVSFRDTKVTGRKYNLTGYTDYGYRTQKPKIEPTKAVSYLDKKTNKTVNAILPLKSVNADKEEWKNDLSIPITFSIYDAEYYKIGNKVVPYNAKKPALKGCEDELLKELKLDKSKYKINSFEWNGSPYEKDGIMYRKAIARGSRNATHFIANYSDTINLPDASGYNATANYGATIKVPTGKKEYKIQATALYKAVTEEENNTPLIKIIVTVIAGILIIVLLIVAILYILSKKRKEEKRNGKITGQRKGTI